MCRILLTHVLICSLQINRSARADTRMVRLVRLATLQQMAGRVCRGAENWCRWPNWYLAGSVYVEPLHLIIDRILAMEQGVLVHVREACCKCVPTIRGPGLNRFLFLQIVDQFEGVRDQESRNIMKYLEYLGDPSCLLECHVSVTLRWDEIASLCASSHWDRPAEPMPQALGAEDRPCLGILVLSFCFTGYHVVNLEKKSYRTIPFPVRGYSNPGAKKNGFNWVPKAWLDEKSQCWIGGKNRTICSFRIEFANTSGVTNYPRKGLPKWTGEV